MARTGDSHSEPVQSVYARRVKRPLDVIVSAMLLVITSPLHALCAGAISLRTGRPVYFRHERVGRHGKTFLIYKFRTMKTETESTHGGYPTSDMITPVGRVLRRWSLDELPQLFNILLGDMSLVGPRPSVRSQVERYTDFQRGRLDVSPGLTGLAQVRHRNNATWSTRIESDVEYATSITCLGDAKIVMATVPIAFTGSGMVENQTAEDVDDLGPPRAQVGPSDPKEARDDDPAAGDRL